MSANFECPYCHKSYTLEGPYMEHRCTQMERAETMQTMIGQQAYSYYGHWMKRNKRGVPTAEVFMTSRFFTYFVNFAKYAKDVDLPDPLKYIDMMVANDINPSLWRHERAYALFLERYSRDVGPEEQAKAMINTIFSLCEAAEVDTSELFTIITPNEVLELLQKRKFTPWLLLNSTTFKQMVAIQFSNEQRTLLEGFIRPVYWKYMFRKHPDVVNKMRIYVKELGL